MNSICRILLNKALPLLFFISSFSISQTKDDVFPDDFAIIKPLQLTDTSSTEPDSTYQYQWDINKNIWLLASKQLLSYEKGLISEIISQVYISEFLKWNNSEKTNNEYDDSGRISKVTDYTWSDEFKRWDNNSMVINTYDSVGRLKEVTAYKWNINSNDWVNYIRNTYYYQNSNDWKELLFTNWDNNNQKWLNFNKHVREFNSAGLPDTETIYSWSSYGQVWENYKMKSITYNINLKPEQITQYIWGLVYYNMWTCSKQINYKYNNANNIEEELTLLCRAGFSNSIKINYAYDTLSRLYEKTEFQWNQTNLDWTNYFREFYFYRGGLTSIEEKNKDIEIYPNPASDYIDITFPNVILSAAKDLGIRIYNVLGVKQNLSFQRRLESSSTLRIDISALATGVYFARVGNVVKKFIKL